MMMAAIMNNEIAALVGVPPEREGGIISMKNWE